MIICHFSSFFDTPSLQCAGSRYLSSGASQMDFSAGGDFPSIAVSINHQHLHHYLTLRTENYQVSFRIEKNWELPSLPQMGLGQYAGVGPIKTFGHLVPLARWWYVNIKNIFLSLTYHSHQGSWIRCRHCWPFPCFLLQCGGEPHL